MYAGQLVEYAEGEKIFTEPKHPYTQGLQAAIPRLDEEKDTLLSIPGNVPMLYELPKGCIFSPRCAPRNGAGAEMNARRSWKTAVIWCGAFCMRTIKNRLRVKAREERRHE